MHFYPSENCSMYMYWCEKRKSHILRLCARVRESELERKREGGGRDYGRDVTIQERLRLFMCRNNPTPYFHYVFYANVLHTLLSDNTRACLTVYPIRAQKLILASVHIYTEGRMKIWQVTSVSTLMRMTEVEVWEGRKSWLLSIMWTSYSNWERYATFITAFTFVIEPSKRGFY